MKNLRYEANLFYFLSNNLINRFIYLEYNLKNEEIVALYTTLLKTLAMKLSSDTIHFFYNIDNNNNKIQNFILYDKALELLTNEETMVRNAAKTILLRIIIASSYKVQEYITSIEKYDKLTLFSVLIFKFNNLFQLLVYNLSISGKFIKQKIETLLQKLQDTIGFYNDLIVSSKVEQLVGHNSSLETKLEQKFIKEVVLEGIVPNIIRFFEICYERKKSISEDPEETINKAVISLVMLTQILEYFPNKLIKDSILKVLYEDLLYNSNTIYNSLISLKVLRFVDEKCSYFLWISLLIETSFKQNIENIKKNQIFESWVKSLPDFSFLATDQITSTLTDVTEKYDFFDLTDQYKETYELYCRILIDYVQNISITEELSLNVVWNEVELIWINHHILTKKQNNLCNPDFLITKPEENKLKNLTYLTKVLSGLLLKEEFNPEPIDEGFHFEFSAMNSLNRSCISQEQGKTLKYNLYINNHAVLLLRKCDDVKLCINFSELAYVESLQRELSSSQLAICSLHAKPCFESIEIKLNDKHIINIWYKVVDVLTKTMKETIQCRIKTTLDTMKLPLVEFLVSDT